LEVKEVEAKLKNLFGYVEVDDEDDDEKAKEKTSLAKSPDTPKQPPAARGRVRIEETLIENVVREVQTRIKIDRFTGGTIHGALFEMMPLWQMNNDDAVHIVMTVEDYKDWEAGLFLYVLKDLWTGDLAIGGEKNVGRGVLQGRRAEIRWKGGHVQLQADAQGRLVNGAAALEPLKFFEQKLQEAIR
jgi:CRISPR/Cas system CSM-associated protein Csm3 (group 7 of RAMP superfamily)